MSAREQAAKDAEQDRRIEDLEVFASRIPSRMSAEGGGGSEAVSAYFKIVSVGSNSLTCNEYNPVADSVASETTVVAKPFMLRLAPFDGETIEFPNGDEITYEYDADNPERKRVSDDGIVTKTQLITPMYYIGEIIRATGIVTGLTASGENIVFEDDNTAGRLWAA